MFSRVIASDLRDSNVVSRLRYQKPVHDAWNPAFLVADCRTHSIGKLIDDHKPELVTSFCDFEGSRSINVDQFVGFLGLESLPSENGLSRNPLAQLVIILACLVHDVDHPGVSNAQSVVEKSHLAVLYKEKSVAEQNSIDLAWTLFADVRFAELRDSICPTPVHLDRFYKLFVKSLLATDISDKDLVAARKETWKQAFLGNGSSNSDTEGEDLKANREIYQANATLELIMQAADVSHTMQQWQVYQKWNRRLFIENTRAHEAGRKLSSTAPPPSVGWFEGELGFFDFVIIPLAQRMQDVGLDQSYLTCAAQNKSQWQSKGESVVNELKRLKLKPITQASI